MVFKYKNCLFVFSFKRAFLGVALIFLSINAWLNFLSSAQMCRENGAF